MLNCPWWRSRIVACIGEWRPNYVHTSEADWDAKLWKREMNIHRFACVWQCIHKIHLSCFLVPRSELLDRESAATAVDRPRCWQGDDYRLMYQCFPMLPLRIALSFSPWRPHLFMSLIFLVLTLQVISYLAAHRVVAQ